MISRKYVFLTITFLCAGSNFLRGYDELNSNVNTHVENPTRMQRVSSYLWNYGIFIAGGGALGSVIASQGVQRLNVAPQTKTMLIVGSTLGGVALTSYHVSSLRKKIGLIRQRSDTVQMASINTQAVAVDNARRLEEERLREEGRREGVGATIIALFWRNNYANDEFRFDVTDHISKEAQNNIYDYVVDDKSDCLTNIMKFVQDGVAAREKRKKLHTDRVYLAPGNR